MKDLKINTNDYCCIYPIPSKEYKSWPLANFKEVIKNYRLIPDTNGKVEVYKKFWNKDEANIDMVPPLLIYTDLKIIELN